MTTSVSAQALREMVRQILTEVIAEEIDGRVGSTSGTTLPRAKRESVTIASQADLDRAVQRILKEAQDPAGRSAIERGDLAFVLVAEPSTREMGQAPVVHRVEKGAVTERHVRAAAEAGAVIVTARRVVITPLARDRSRSMGVLIRKDS